MKTQAEQTAEQKTSRELIKEMGKPKKYTVYLNYALNTVVQTNCLEIEEKGQKIARFDRTARIVTNK